MYVVKKISFPKGDWGEYEKQVNAISENESLVIDETLEIDEYGGIENAYHIIRFKRVQK